MSVKILLTGGAGFIGSAMAARLALRADHDVTVVDNLVTGSMKKVPVSIHRNIRFVKADTNHRDEMNAIFKEGKFDYVFHYAALAGVLRTLKHPTMVLADIDGIKNILELSRDHRIKRVFYSSSSEVYGEPVHIPQNEHTTPLNSRLPYAIVKNLGEAFLRSYHSEFGLEYGIFRFFNTYGPNQTEDFVISRFIHAALQGKDITIYGDGSQSRTFCYIDDNTWCCDRIFNEGLFMNDVVNVGSDIEVSILDLARMIIRVAGSSSNIMHVPPLPEGDMTRRQPDITKMNSIMGTNRVSLEEGIRKTIQSFK